MGKKNRTIACVGILIALSICRGVTDTWAQKATKATRAPRSARTKEKAPDMKAAEPAAAGEKGPVKYTGMETRRDPFALPPALAKALEKPKAARPGERVDDKVALPKVVVQGIIWNPHMPQVIVNNTVMRVGDFIEQFEIKEITQRGIVLFYQGREYEMLMQSLTAPSVRPGRKR